MFIKNFNTYFFFAILLGVSFAGFLLIKPFLGAIFIAALIAVMFTRPYNFTLKRIKSPAITSAIMLLVVAITIVLPFIFVGSLVFNEVSDVVTKSVSQNSSTQNSVQRILGVVANIPFMGIVFERVESYMSGPELATIIKNVANHSLTFIQVAYRGLIGSIISIFVMFFALFYFFIDGKKIVSVLMNLSPMKNKYEQGLINEFISMTRATLKGTVVIGFIQGIIGGVAFFATGVVSPILWTVVMIVLGIIPAVGAGLVIFPVSIIMLLLGHMWQGIFLLIVGIFVSSIDNVLRPKLVGKDVQMHSLAVFFATLGGLKLFGIMGFIIGPIIMALMLAMWKIYALEFKKELEQFNA